MTMTAESTASTKRSKSLFVGYALWRGRQFSARNVLTLVLCLTGLPFCGLCLFLMYGSNYGYGNNEGIMTFTLMAVGVLSLTAQVGLALTAALNHMDWLLRPALTDQRWSLPMKKRSMFLADFLAGLIPLTVCQLLGAGIFMLIALAARSNSPSRFNDITMGAFAVLALSAIIVVLFCYIFNIFVIACVSGTNIAVGGYALILHILLPAAVVIGFVALFLNVPTLDFTGALMNATAYSSPAGLAIITLLAAFTQPVSDTLTIFPAANPGIIVTIIIMIGLAAGGYYIVGKRQSESVGRSNRTAHAVLSSAVLFLVCGLFILGALDSASSSVFPIILSMLITTAFVYFVAELITLSDKTKRLQSMGRSAIRYFLTVIAAGLVFSILPALQVFGAGYSLPNREDVESVGLYSYAQQSYNEYEMFVLPDLPDSGKIYKYFSTSNYPLIAVFDEKENIDTLYDMHKRYNNDRRDNLGTALLLEYKLKDGSTFSRRIFPTDQQSNEELLRLQLTEDYLNYRFNRFESAYIDIEKPVTWSAVYMNTAGAQGSLSEDTQGWTSNEGMVGKEIYEAYKADRLEHRSYDEIYGSVAEGYVWVDAFRIVGHDNIYNEDIKTNYSLRLEVLSCYERMHAVMAKYNLRFPAWSEYNPNSIILKDTSSQRTVSISAENVTEPKDLEILQKIEGHLHLLRPGERFMLSDDVSLGLPDSVTEQEMAAFFDRMRQYYNESLRYNAYMGDSPVEYYY